MFTITVHCCPTWRSALVEEHRRRSRLISSAPLALVARLASLVARRSTLSRCRVRRGCSVQRLSG